jgi:hypothetical protein
MNTIFIMTLLLPVSALLWALGRATTEAIAFEWADNEHSPFLKTMDTYDYHSWTCLEAIGLFIFAIPNAYFASLNNRSLLAVILWGLYYSILMFGFYYLPYTLRFNNVRGQEFYFHKGYKIRILGRKYTLPYPSVTQGIIMYLISLSLLITVAM